MAGTPAVFEATMNRDQIVRLVAAAKELGAPIAPPGEVEGTDFDPSGPADDGNPFGTAEGELTHAVDVHRYVTAKRESIRCHASQVTDTGFFLQMPDDIFAMSFGTEWFIKKGSEPGVRPGWLFE